MFLYAQHTPPHTKLIGECKFNWKPRCECFLSRHVLANHLSERKLILSLPTTREGGIDRHRKWEGDSERGKINKFSNKEIENENKINKRNQTKRFVTLFKGFVNSSVKWCCKQHRLPDAFILITFVEMCAKIKEKANLHNVYQIMCVRS